MKTYQEINRRKMLTPKLKTPPLHSRNSGKYAKILDFSQTLQANFCWRIGLILCKYLRIVGKKYITTIAIKTDITNFILFKLVAYIALGTSV